jgi:ankyrin repeat protein
MNSTFFSDDFLNNRDDEDSTPVHIASLRNHTEVLRVLIEYGADITVVSRSLPGAGNTVSVVPLFLFTHLLF